MPHIHEKIDFTVNVYIVHDDKVLIRKHDKYDVWLGVGGHIDLDEDPNEAAVREAFEEAGLKVTLVDTREYVEENEIYKELIVPMAMNRHRINDSHEHISLEYVATADSDKVSPQEESDASHDWKWYSYDEIDEAEELREHVKFLAKKAIDQVRKYNGV